MKAARSIAVLLSLHALSWGDEQIKTPAIPGMTIPAGTRAHVFATTADHELVSPSALCLQEDGSVLVAEVHRLTFGVEDNSDHKYWVLDDNASDGTAYRREFHNRWLHKVPMKELTEKSEKVRYLADTDGDNVANVSKVYATGFNDVLDGLAGGIYAFEGTTYFACIPHIWTLRDNNKDGVSDEKKSLFEGFGTRVSISGHDLNGFVLGPDGRLYGTMGDRSMRVTNKEGREFYLRNQGCAFRFDSDGSNFEVFHTGLRNPKELAFDKWGNAVTVDNNSDQGDQSRLVYLMEGGDSGWRVGHQNMSSYHPQVGYPKRPINQWMAELQWKTPNDKHPAFLLPPIHNFTRGPAGLTYQPGTGLSNNCVDSFLVCDYVGGAGNSGIWAFGIKPKGAGIEIVNPRKWNWGAAVTDVEYGYDGKVYVTDFIGGWKSHHKGRLYVLSAEKEDPLAAETARLVKEGFSHRSQIELQKLIGHADQRVRLRATLALSHKQNALDRFREATKSTNPLQRLHAVWGLGMLARRDDSKEATQKLVDLLEDLDDTIRGQAARVLGEAPLIDRSALQNTLRDPSSRIRSFAAISLGRLKAAEHFSDIVSLLASNKESDPYLRHAGVMGLVGCGTVDTIAALSKHKSSAVRLAAVVALRRLSSEKVLAFLADEDPRVRDEVIRSVHDVMIEPARPSIAAVLDNYRAGGKGRPLTRMLFRRLIHSAFRVGGSENAARLLQLAANSEVPEEERLEALRLLTLWTNPPVVDQSTGEHAPLNPHSASDLKLPFEKHLPALLETEGSILAAAMDLMRQYGFGVKLLTAERLRAFATDEGMSVAARTGAMTSLVERNDSEVDALLNQLLGDKVDAVSVHALTLIVKRHPKRALELLKPRIAEGSLKKKQAAWRLTGTLKDATSAQWIATELRELPKHSSPSSHALEVIEAADKRTDPLVKDALAAYRKTFPKDKPFASWRPVLNGGDPTLGADVFKSHAAAQCMRCHRADRLKHIGEIAGPNLADLGKRRDKEHILRSLLAPNDEISPGFGLTSLTLKTGETVAGTLLAQTETSLDVLSGPDVFRIRKADIRTQAKPASAMPPMGELLTQREMRDLLAWLVTLDNEGALAPTYPKAKAFP